jgi:hypothetical protein
VQAGASRVKVLGTRFSVTRLGEIARVKVYEGVVEVTSGGQAQRVRAGEEWPTVEVRRAINDTSPPVEPDSSTTAPVASTAPSSSGPLSVNERPRKKAVATRQQPAASSTVPKPQPSASTSTTSAIAKEGRPSSQAVFEQATLLEPSDPARAAQLYRSLESRADSWAPNALYARGRLAASRGNPGEARRLLQLYLQRFPRGSNAEDARAVLRRLR